jgi:hypothetical protein
MIEYIKKFASTHVFYLVVLAIGAIAFHSWLGEHDARLQAAQEEKAAEVLVKASQDQINALQSQIASNDAKAQQQIDALTKVVQAVKTPQQVVSQLPIVAPNLPVPATVQTDDSITFPKADVLPLFQDLADGKIAATKLEQCQTDYSAEQQIAAQKDEQLKQKGNEIAALKQKPSFWKRAKGTLKSVGIGVGIGVVIASHFGI